MKYLAHIPVEQYGFISVEIEGSAEDAVKAYKAVQKAHWNHSELNTRDELNSALDELLVALKDLNKGLTDVRDSAESLTRIITNHA